MTKTKRPDVRWIRMGDIYKANRIDDDVPSGLHEIYDMLDALIDRARELKIEILIAPKKTVLMLVNCTFKHIKKEKNE